MESNGLRKIFSIFIIAFMLSWSFAPSVSMAFFIKPGKPITPGEAITPGQPISGGQFIIPGDPIIGGESYLSGSEIKGGKKPVSGQPIIPQYQGFRGKFIIPNVAISPGHGLLTGSPITSGEGPSGGQGVTGGTGPNGGQGVTGGTGPNGGQGLTGGTGPNGGQGLTGGTGPNGGQGVTGGTGPNGGQGVTGGTGPNGGQGVTGGTGPSGGQGSAGGTGPNGGQGSAVGIGQNSSGNSGGGSPSSLLNILFSTTKANGPLEFALALIKDTKTWGFGVLKPVLEGGTAAYAGFNFEKNKAGNYNVVGKTRLDNPFFNHFYDKYKNYKIGDKTRYMPVNKSTQRPFKVTSFFESKKLLETRSGMLNATWKNLKSSMNDSYNVLSKKFWAKSNITKLSGPVGIASNLVKNFTKNVPLSSKFAGFTTDLGIGALTTAASSIVSSMATGAVAGSVAPGIGTIIGAAAGLTTGILIAVGIEKTPIGRRSKKWVNDTLTKGYSYVGRGINKITNYSKGLFESTKKLFGFS